MREDKKLLKKAKAIFAGLIITSGFCVPYAGARTAPKPRIESKSVEISRTVDRGRVETLQRWVMSGHDAWCLDARAVAEDEFSRLAPDFSVDQLRVEKAVLTAGDNGSSVQTFEWTPADGRANYRVTVERFNWLLPVAGVPEAIVWVPTRAVIIPAE